MRIAILVLLFPPKWIGGTELATYNVARHLARKGHEVHVITSLDKGLPKESIEAGFHVHRVGSPNIQFLRTSVLWLRMLLVAKKLMPDIVHAQSTYMGTNALLMKLFLRKPCVVWGRGSDIYVPSWYEKMTSKYILKHADSVIAQTEDMKREMQKIYDRDVQVIPNGITLEEFDEFSREKSRASLQIGKNEHVIVYVGTLRQVKGVKYLISAMDIITQHNSGVKLMLVGDGWDREQLETQVKEMKLDNNVIFSGRVPRENVPEYLTASDVLVLPSLAEGFPNVVLEAMACGLPVVATRVGGMSELINEGENGFLVEPKKPEKIAEKLLLLLDDDNLRARIARNNSQRVREYTWEEVARRLEEIYESHQ